MRYNGERVPSWQPRPDFVTSIPASCVYRQADKTGPLRPANQQVADFGAGMDGMLPVEVTEGRDGELMINNGVTRATRIHYLAPGQLIPVEVADTRPRANFAKLLCVRDVPPPQ